MIVGRVSQRHWCDKEDGEAVAHWALCAVWLLLAIFSLQNKYQNILLKYKRRYAGAVWPSSFEMEYFNGPENKKQNLKKNKTKKMSWWFVLSAYLYF